MITSVDNLLTQYDTGELSRRTLLAAIALIAVPRPARAQQGLFRARSLHHVNIGVSDLATSATFFRNLLGSPPNRPMVGGGGESFALDFSDSGFISLCRQPGGSCSVAGPGAQPGRIDHFGVGIDDFDADRVMSELAAAGIEGAISARTSVLVPAPDGVFVQLSDPSERFDTVPDTARC